MKNSPWGEIEVCDAHLHFFSPVFFDTLATQKGSTPADVGTALGWEVPESVEYLADRWVVEMNHHGVDRAVLVGSVPVDAESVGVAVDRHPSRFRAVSMVNPMLTGSDLRCDRALSAGQLSGVFLFPTMHRYSMHEGAVRSLLATVAGHPGSIVYVHCGMLSTGFRRKLGLASPWDLRYSNPIDLHETLLEFPNLPFVIPHFGAGYFREVLMLGDLCPNLYIDTSSSNRWMATQTASMNLTEVFRRALDVFGPQRLLFGTDSSWFPRGWTDGIFDAQASALAEAGADATAAKAIFGGNLSRLLRF